MLLLAVGLLALLCTAAQEAVTQHESVGVRHQCNDTASVSIAAHASAAPWLYLLAALFAVAAARSGATAYTYSDLSDMEDSEPESPGAREDPHTPDGAEPVDEHPLFGPEPELSSRVDIGIAHDPGRRVDLDALAGQTTAGDLLHQERSAVRSVSEGGGRQVFNALAITHSTPHRLTIPYLLPHPVAQVVIPLKVYLATHWHPGSTRLWYRLQHHMAFATWILCTSESFMLFIKRDVVQLLMRKLYNLGEFVRPAEGHSVDKVVFAKRKRGPIGTHSLLAALEQVALEQGDESLQYVVYVTVGDRLPLHNYPLPSPMAPLGHAGARLLDYFGQHPKSSTHLLFVDVAVHGPLYHDTATGDTTWPLFLKRSRAERLARPAAVNLYPSEMDQYNQHGMDGGWMKVRTAPWRRRQLAADAIDAHAPAARDELRTSRLDGSGPFWEDPVRFGYLHAYLLTCLLTYLPTYLLSLPHSATTYFALALLPKFITCRCSGLNKAVQQRRIFTTSVHAYPRFGRV